MSRDVAKIAAALERPGIDPRKFVELAIVTAVAVDDSGVHCDVVTVDGMHETVALATPYGGDGYGIYGPIQLDDAVLIAIPDGKFNAGGRVVARIWDRGAPPPAEVTAHPEDVAIVVRKGQTIRIVVSGGGNAVIEARDGGKVLLGGEDANDPVMRKSDVAAFIATYYKVHTHTAPGGTTGPPLIAAQTPAGSPIVLTK